MAAMSAFRKALEAAVDERHCADHPMTEAWAKGTLGKDCLKGWAVEQYHWVSNMRVKDFYICAHAPNDVIDAQLGTRDEEIDPEHSHLDIMLRFAAANGGDVAAVKAGHGLPTTRSWVAWIDHVAVTQPWYAAIAATKVASESQSPRLYSKILPAMREIYKFAEPDIEHFWLHSEVDIEHGDEGYRLLEHHCTTSEQQELCIHYAREGARMRWFHFDGIYLHYEKSYALA
jgi:pyrroloquinoline-quinone synthase